MNMTVDRIDYSLEDFEFIRRIMLEKSGINLNAAKRELVYSRLAKRIRQLGLLSFSDYRERLRNDKDELCFCVNAMTTNVTSFFRECHHFEFLKQVVFPEFLARANLDQTNTIRIWSAGCSSGEEPYSIAIAAREFFGEHPLWRIDIDATDLDSTVLSRAEGGVYRDRDVESLERERLHRWFRKGVGENAGRVRVVPEIREMVTYRQLNLKDPWPDRDSYDIIFCRNVMIYFDMAMKREIVSGCSDLLKEGGYLFVGHSESLFGLSDQFEIVGKTIHRRKRVAHVA